MSENAALFKVHTPTGPVYCCAAHADKLCQLMSVIGVVPHASVYSGDEQCSNCVNEAKHANAIWDQPQTSTVPGLDCPHCPRWIPERQLKTGNVQTQDMCGCINRIECPTPKRPPAWPDPSPPDDDDDQHNPVPVLAPAGSAA